MFEELLVTCNIVRAYLMMKLSYKINFYLKLSLSERNLLDSIYSCTLNLLQFCPSG